MSKPPDNPDSLGSLGGAYPTRLSRLSETGIEKLLIFPDKLKALLNISLEKEENFQADLSYPISVELSLSYRCDLNCVYCSDRLIRKAPDLLNKEILEGLFSDLVAGGTKGIVIEGGGEPTLSPFFVDAVELGRSHKLSLGLLTNGYAIFKHVPKELYQSFQWIRVSLDAADEGQFRLLKGKSGFSKTMENIELLASLPEGPVVGVGYVLTKKNSDIVKLNRLCEDLKGAKVSYISIRPVVDHPELDDVCDLSKLNKLSDESFKVDLEPLKANQESGNLALPCYAHSLSVVIGAEGKVWLCGRLNFNPDFPAMGSLLNSRFRDIWRGETRRAQAALVRSGKYCEDHCPRCRMTKYNALIHQLGRLSTPDFI
ncbi:MAG: radical SAM protein [Deltaproteobacteria bacterium]|jgi:MoaA/NifB/PqqE/SkfB family radical SAM enzyme|nr:radical SAM protein [Deltaproteobacteria bacterium]